MNRMNLVILLDRMERLIESAPEIPLTGRSLIDGDEALELLEKIREAIPEEVKRAEWVANEKDRVLQEGQAEADRMLEEAESYVKQLVSESKITQQAQEQARQMIEEAKAASQEMEAGSVKYADETLTDLQETLEKALKVVRRGRESLKR